MPLTLWNVDFSHYRSCVQGWGLTPGVGQEAAHGKSSRRVVGGNRAELATYPYPQMHKAVQIISRLDVWFPTRFDHMGVRQEDESICIPYLTFKAMESFPPNCCYRVIDI